MDLDAIKTQALELIWNPWGAALALFGIAWWFFGMVLGSNRYWRYALVFARNQRLRRSYRAYLTPVLDWLDRRFSPEHIGAGRPATDWRRAWGWRLYDKCLLIAVVYPLLSLFLIWGFSGAEGRIGDLIVLEGDVAGWRRALALVAISAEIAIIVYAGRYLTSWIQFIPATLVIAVGGIFAFLVAFIAAFIFSATFGFASAIVGAFAFAKTLAFVVAISVGLAACIVGAIANAAMPIWAHLKSRCRGVLRLIISLYYIAVLIAIITQFAATEDMDATDIAISSSLIIFLAILPLINAVFDFVSIGVTRWCLRCGLVNARGWPAVVWTLIDFGLALLMLVLLGMASMTVLHFLTFADDVRLFDVGALFQGENSLLNAPPYTYTWLYFMLFSTLLPTFLHLIVGMFAAFDALPRGVGRWLARRIRRAKDEDIDRNIARLVLSGLTVIAVAIPVGATMLLIHLAASGPLFNLFHWWSEVIGAV